ncbi:MAG: hypothetical protein JST40_04295 [Armatimonadetes bacterium]|nr:hypothetical protein [Armatimonadota bacterium]
MTSDVMLGQSLHPSADELRTRDAVLAAILDSVEREQRISLPPFDPKVSIPGAFALETIGIEPNPFGGSVGIYRYQFEGEEDLLHLMVFRLDGGELTPQEGQMVAAFLLPTVSPTQVWFKPGEFSQHFYLGHDILLQGGSEVG